MVLIACLGKKLLAPRRYYHVITIKINNSCCFNCLREQHWHLGPKKLVKKVNVSYYNYTMFACLHPFFVLSFDTYSERMLRIERNLMSSYECNIEINV